VSLVLPNAEQQFCDGNGIPLAGGFVYMYTVGTTTPVVTYSDYLLSVQNSNPIVLDGNGRCRIWGVGAFQQMVTDQYGNLIWNQVTSDGSINPASQFAPISGSLYYAPASGSPNYAPVSGSLFYASINGSATETFLVANATAGDMAVSLSQAQAQSYNFSIDTGTLNSIVATLIPAVSGFADGEILTVRIAVTNTATSVLNVNGVGAATITYSSGSALVGGEMVAGRTSVFVWSAASSQWVLLNPIVTGTTQLGIGQTYVNEAGSRAIGFSYTNSGTAPIFVVVVVTNSTGPTAFGIAVLVSGAGIYNDVGYASGAGYRMSASFIVPVGASYQVNSTASVGTMSVVSWFELR